MTWIITWRYSIPYNSGVTGSTAVRMNQQNFLFSLGIISSYMLPNCNKVIGFGALKYLSFLTAGHIATKASVKKDIKIAYGRSDTVVQ